MVEVYIGIGSNLGNRLDNINKAIEYLRQLKGLTVKKVSSIIESKPQGACGPDYLNAVMKIQTTLAALDLLDLLQICEKEIGRKTSYRNAPRLIDLDILLYGRQIIDEPRLCVPHPRMSERDFVLKPLLEIEPRIAGKLEALKIKK